MADADAPTEAAPEIVASTLAQVAQLAVGTPRFPRES
jgi:hypothetical protein